MSKQIGFIGLGKMGLPMAHLLHQAGYRLTVFDRVQSQSLHFEAAHSGTAIAGGLAQFADVEVVITMLPDSAAVESVILGNANRPGLIDFLPPGVTIIDMSSSQPLRSRRLAEILADCGLHFLDAPVSGGVKRAIDGTLAIMVGGEAAHVELQHDLFAVLGQTITHVGPPGAGHAIKALNNYVSAAGLIAAAEALHVGQTFGLDPALMTDVFNSATGKNNTTENKVKQYMLSQAFNSGFALQLMVKDLETAVDLAAKLNQVMAFGQATLALWAEANEALGASADHTEMYRYLQSQHNTGAKRSTRDDTVDKS